MNKQHIHKEKVYTNCRFCNTEYGMDLDHYIAFLTNNSTNTWRNVCFCDCSRSSFGVKLDLIEDNNELQYKKIQVVTTFNPIPKLIIWHNDGGSVCAICGIYNKVSEHGNYWVCSDNKSCKQMAKEWTKLDGQIHETENNNEWGVDPNFNPMNDDLNGENE